MASADRSPVFYKRNYLVAYNLVSAVLWGAVLGRVLLLLPVFGSEHIYDAVGEYAKWVQTGALLEVVHSLTGIVRAPLLTTAMQVASRILLVWGVVDRHPGATAPSAFYSSMLIAWSVTEVIRYGYFVMSLKSSGGPMDVPPLLSWLRYNTFFVLYPMGITSEVVMMVKATRVASSLEATFLWVVLGFYVPGSYVLYTHMMKQRRRMIKGKQPARPRVDSVKSQNY